MAISASLLIWYKCLNWTEAATHGGDIDVSSTINSGAMNNIFDNVSNAERLSGATDARKIYFRNENTDTYAYTKCWIEANTPATNDTIYIRLGGTAGEWGQAIALTGTATFTNGATYVWTSADQTASLTPGEYVYNSTDDTVTQAGSVNSVFATGFYLADNFEGTSGSSKSVAVASVGFASVSWYQPASKLHASVLEVGSLTEDSYKAIWIKRVVTAGGDGYDTDSFTLSCENATS